VGHISCASQLMMLNYWAKIEILLRNKYNLYYGLVGSRSRNDEKSECTLVLRYHNARQYHNIKRVSSCKCVKEQKFWNDRKSDIAWRKY
jgi:hypothetical protein